MITPFDRNEALPAWDLFDNDMIRMAISAAKDEYDTAKKDQKEFMDKYGDFYSPIQADMDWHNENVINKFQNTINDLYARGIDPLRTPEGRAAIQNAINSVDIGRIARNKVSAQNAEKYLENMARLDAAGKYDSSLEKDYLGYDLSKFDSSKGVWDRLSPTEAMSLKQLTESSFNNRTPHVLTEQDVRDFGMEYDPRAQYTGFTYNDLLNIANTAAPGLTGTVHADYFRHLAEQKLKQYGIKNPTKQQIDSQLAQDIANSQIEYMVHPEADYNDYYKRQSLALQREGLKLRRMANLIAQQRVAQRNAGNQKGQQSTGNQKEKQQFDYNDFLIGTTAANVLKNTTWGDKLGVGGVSDYNPENVGMFMKSAQQEIASNVYDYNIGHTQNENYKLFGSKNPQWQVSGLQESLQKSLRKNVLKNTGIDLGSFSDISGKPFVLGATQRPTDNAHAAVYDKNLHEQNLKFLSQISLPYNEDSFAIGTKRPLDSDNKMYALMTESDASRIYSADEVALTSAGVDRPNDVHTSIEKTKQLRKNFENRFEDGKTMMKSEGFVVGRVGDDGSHHIFQKIRISNKYKTPGKSEESVQDFHYKNIYDKGEVIYYDMGIDTQESPDFKFTGNANMTPIVTDQSLALDRAVLKELGVGNTNVKSDESLPDIYNSYDDDFLDLMGY